METLRLATRHSTADTTPTPTAAAATGLPACYRTTLTTSHPPADPGKDVVTVPRSSHASGHHPLKRQL